MDDYRDRERSDKKRRAAELRDIVQRLVKLLEELEGAAKW